MSTEKSYKPVSGYTMSFVVLLMVIAGAMALITRHPIGGVILFICLPLLGGFFFINPNSSVVLVLFGDYKGTVKDNGFHWVNPFFMKKKFSLRARNFDSEKIKVNDKVGNPIQRSA
jgi:regulator of protease activity HflC (stomatin/prohibitin superfamily)